MKKLLLTLFAFALFSPVLASAHVVVKPNQANVGSFMTFSIGVPVEKNMPTTAVRLVVPAGLEYVTPNVKPGWKIDVKKDGEKTTEISWTGGSIPAGQRDEFVFSAKVPTSEGELQWKAYQTYRDGTTVSWDQNPSDLKEDDESKPVGPYSVTKIVDDLKESTSSAEQAKTTETRSMLPVIAIAMSGLALAMQLFGKKAA